MAAPIDQSMGTPQKGSLAKKRKKLPVSDNTDDSEVERKNQQFTEVDFKFLLRDPNTTFSGTANKATTIIDQVQLTEGFVKSLEKFVDAADSYPDDNSYDIVAGYCRSSAECAEVFQILEAGKRKPTEIHQIFSCLECILLRVAGDLGKHRPVGLNIVRRILAAHMKTVLFSLGMKNKSSHIKTTLKLLTAMVMIGADMTKSVLTQFDFSHQNFRPLFNRRDSKDEEDVRTCLLQFLMAILLVGDNDSIRLLMEQKDVLASIFAGFVFDRVHVIEQVLTTLQDKVVSNTSVSKTAKIKLFNEHSLKFLGYLFMWKGPSKWKEKSLTGKKQEDMEVEDDDHASERETVSEMVQAFLLKLCCSFKYGICFMDKAHGTSGRNQNHVLSSFLMYLGSISQNALVQEVIIKILQTCPDQIRHFLPSILNSLSPRPTEKWVATVKLLGKIYSAQPVDPPVLKSGDHFPTDKLVSIFLSYTIPPKQTLNTILPGLKHKSLSVRHMTLDFLRLVLQNAVLYYNLLCKKSESEDQSGVYSKEELREVSVSYKEAILKALPSVQEMFHCWDRQTEMQTGKTEEAENEIVLLRDLHGCDITAHIVKIEQVLCLYQELSPSTLVDNPVILSKLLEGIKSPADQEKGSGGDEVLEQADSAMLPQLYLLKLLAGTDARRLSWTKANRQGHSLMYLLLEMVARPQVDDKVYKITENLVCRLLESTGLFESAWDELQIWMRNLHDLNKDSSVSNVLDFMSKVFMTYVSNPYPYIERVVDIRSEVTAMDSEKMEKCDAKSAKITIEDILKMDMDSLLLEEEEEDLEDTQHTQTLERRYPFCPVLLVAMDAVKSDSQEDVKLYLSKVLLEIFHTSSDIQPLAVMLSSISKTCLVKQLHSYIQSWISNKLEEVKVKSLEIVTDSFSYKLMQLHADPSHAHKDKFWQGVHTLLAGLAQEKLPYAVSCVLLHVKYFLEHTSVESDVKITTVKALLHLLGSVVEKMKVEQKENKSTMSGEEDDEAEMEADGSSAVSDNNTTGHNNLDAEFSLLQVRSETPEERFHTVVQTVLSHDAVLKYFLPGSDGVKTDAFELFKLVIEFVKQTLESLKQEVPVNLQRTLEVYLNNILKLIRNCLNSKMDVEEPQELHVIQCCLQCLQVMLGQSSSCMLWSVLEEMMSLPVHIFTDKNSSVYKSTLIVTDILTALIKGGKVSRTAGIKCSLSKFETLFAIVANSHSDELETAVVQFVDAFPDICLSCSTESFKKVLCGLNENRLRLVQTCMRQNMVLLWTFQTWSVQQDSAVSCDQEFMVKLMNTSLCKMDVMQEGINPEFAQYVVDHLKDDFLQLCSDSLCCSYGEELVQILECLLRNGLVDKSLVHTFEKKLYKTICLGSNVVPCQVLALQTVLQGLLMTEEQSHKMGGKDKLLSACIHCLTRFSRSKTDRHFDLENIILDVMGTVSEEEVNGLQMTFEALKESFSHFIKGSLKLHYCEERLLHFLTLVLPRLYREDTDIQPPASTLLEMVMTHSSFLPVMFNEEKTNIKGPLVEFWLCLVQIDPASCSSQHIGILLGAYGASLSITDQSLLKLLHLYESGGVTTADYRPYLWGDKAIEHHMVKRSLGPSLLKQPTMVQILDNLDADRMQKTILNFPLRRKLQPNEVKDPSTYKSLSECYDPGFLLPLFSHLLSPDSVVDCRKFIETDCLSYTFAALSSHDAAVRSAAYHILESYQLHLQAASFHEQQQVLYLLDLLRNSLETPNMKLASIISVFLAKAAKLMLKPDDHMYGLINSFLLIKPALDILNVPEFYKLFKSSSLEHKTERGWILSLLVEGMRETADYRIYEKRYIFKIIQSYFDCSLSDSSSQVKILQVLKSACGEKTVARDLFKHHGISTWLTGVIRDMPCERVNQISLLVDIVKSLWYSQLGDRNKVDNSDEKTATCLPLMVSRQILALLKCLLWKLRDIPRTVMCSYLTVLLSVLDHIQLTTSTTESGSHFGTSSNLNLQDVCLLVCFCCRFNTFIVGCATNILINLGFDVSEIQPRKSRQVAPPGLAYKSQEETTADDPSSVDLTKSSADAEEKNKKSSERTAKITYSEQESLTFSLLKVLLHWNPTARPIVGAQQSVSFKDIETKAAGVVMVTRWLLGEITENFGLELFGNTIEWIRRQFVSENGLRDLLLQLLLDGDGEESVAIRHGLVCIYSKVFRLSQGIKACKLKNVQMLENKSGNSEVRHFLQKVLAAVNMVLRNMALRKVQNEDSGDSCNWNLAVKEIEEKTSEEQAMTLRQYFLGLSPPVVKDEMEMSSSGLSSPNKSHKRRKSEKGPSLSRKQRQSSKEDHSPMKKRKKKV